MPTAESEHERTRFITHGGRRVLLLDFSGLGDPESSLREIANAMRVIARQPRGSLLVLTDVTGARYDAEVVQALKDLAAHNKPYVKASAIVGMQALHRLIYRAVVAFTKRNIEVFEDRDSALDWLLTQA